jgi:hypothetical protein
MPIETKIVNDCYDITVFTRNLLVALLFFDINCVIILVFITYDPKYNSKLTFVTDIILFEYSLTRGLILLAQCARFRSNIEKWSYLAYYIVSIRVGN